MKTNIIQTPDLKKAAQRLRGKTEFFMMNNDYKDLVVPFLVGKKYFIKTYGCQANVRDEETMRGIFENAGMTGSYEPVFMQRTEIPMLILTRTPDFLKISVKLVYSV
jgi:tRNA-2-methylthio-N6-dimethylallyladenosine synthase